MYRSSKEREAIDAGEFYLLDKVEEIEIRGLAGDGESKQEDGEGAVVV